MSTEIASPAKLCICYSRKDEGLLAELVSHLSVLERRGLVRSWYDRTISPGEEWRKEIDENLRDADIILLLISADFVASKFCWEVETSFALQKHKSGEGIVIPIRLRPINWTDLPFAELQGLPGNGSFVTGYGDDVRSNRDSAYTAIVEGVEKAVIAFRTRKIQAYSEKSGAGSVPQRRFLEAAVASEIPKGESRELTVMVSLDETTGLRPLLAKDAKLPEKDRIYSATTEDVRASEFESEFGLTLAGFLRSPEFVLKLSAPGFSPEEQSKRVFLPTMTSSKPYSFVLRGQTLGQHLLNIEMICDDVAIVEQLLKTRVAKHGGPDRKPPTGGIVVASIPVQVACVARAASAIRAVGSTQHGSEYE